MTYMGPLPWYLQLLQLWRALWSESGIYLIVNHIHIAPWEIVMGVIILTSAISYLLWLARRKH